MVGSVQLLCPRALPETARTLRRLGLRITADGSLTIASASSPKPRKAGPSGKPAPLLVPKATTPARTLALFRKLSKTAAGPFFAAGQAGQINAALFAAACLAARDPQLRRALDRFRSRQTSSVPWRP